MPQNLYRLAWVLLLGIAFSQATIFAAQKSIRLRFLDSETGYAVQPDEVSIDARRASVRSHVATLDFERGSHMVAVSVANYKPMAGQIEVADDFPYTIHFVLDPIVVPKEVSTDYVASLHQKDETVFVGYVVDEERGEPLAGVRVRTEPSGKEAWTDARGYFQIHVPLQTLAEAQTSPAKLVFEKHGYKIEERHYLELWSEGDWVYRIRLNEGAGRVVVDERQLRRRNHWPIEVKEEKKSPSQTARETKNISKPENILPEPVHLADIPKRRLASTTASFRIPTNIRVLQSDNVTIDYISMETYTARSLGSEWISSWATTGPGNCGSNSLNAGAVAVRTFAAGYVNTPIASTYDICGSTSCQVYNPANGTSAATKAANFTAGYVMFRPGDARVGFKLTEYSAENNQLSLSCGDGYTAPTGGCLFDPVCSGETENGHGRGMCQWGTARWASGRKMAGPSTGDTTTNGYPIQDWIWICEHYYPTLVLAKGSPLAVGDDVVVIGSSVAVRQCPGNTITNGTLCPTVTGSKTVGTTGTIIGGPQLVTADGNGYTWWQVQWSDTNGWSIESNLERVSATPAAPTDLTATPVSISQIDLAWTDNSANEIGYTIERATASGGPWVTNEVVRAGITSYSNTNVAANTTYYYRVRGFNQSAVSAYSNTTNATTPNSSYPIITAQPSSQIKGTGQTATLIVGVTGNSPLNYQWKKNGTSLADGGNISGTMSSILTISSLQSSDAASYTVVVTNASGSATSSIATLTVSGFIVFQDDFDSNTAASWVTNRMSTDTRVTFNYDYSADGIPFAPHSVGGTTRAVKFEANVASGVAAALNISPVGQTFTGDYKLRFDMWININGPLPGGGTGSTEYITGGIGTTGTRVQWTGSGTTADGVWFSVNGEGGATDTSATTADFNAYTATTVQATASGVYAAGTASNARGNGNAYYATQFPAGQTPPVFQQNNYAQQTGTLSIGTVGFKWRNVLINKQGNVIEWFIDDLKIASITNATLAGNNIFIGYWDPFASVSDNAALSFGLVDNVRVEVASVAPSISAQPQSRTNAVGTSANFNVTAGGTPSPGYQWRFNGVNLGSATQSSYTLGSVQTNDAGGYSVVVSNSVGSVTSAVATLTVIIPPVITTPPANISVVAGSNATFSVVASGTAPFNYQWRFNGANIGSATQSSYSITGVQTNDAGSYSVIVSNASGSVTSSVATLTITVPPGITTQPSSLFVAAGSNATFSVVATGAAPLIYQWRFNGAGIGSATQSSYTRTNAQTADAGNYTVVVTNSSGAITSSVAVLVVNNPPTLAAIGNRSVHVGSTLVISNSATDPDTNALTFSLLAGAPSDATINPTNGLFSWTTTNAPVGATSNLTVSVTDDGVPPLSDTKTFSVSIIPQIMIQSIVVSNNSTVSFSWNSAPNATYRAQYKTNITQAGWFDLMPDVVAPGLMVSRTENIVLGEERYYRVMLVGY